MEWNLRMAAAQRGIWRANELRRLLAEGGLQISSGKMSYLWSGKPISLRLDDLDVICSVLDCEPSELLSRSRRAVKPPAEATAEVAPSPTIRPSRRRGSRSQPPV
ncbi:MAG TPA: helix-turn-helix transcriptional regulator [Actinomycetota bacterium]|nr:helix-turn-helix transcriptional regulator [Actinomycetota bacterium]